MLLPLVLIERWRPQAPDPAFEIAKTRAVTTVTGDLLVIKTDQPDGPALRQMLDTRSLDVNLGAGLVVGVLSFRR